MSNRDVYRLLQRGGGVVARAVRSYELDGGQVCDVFNSDTGDTWRGCPVLESTGVPIGAPSEVFNGTKPLSGYPLVLLIHQSELRVPIVLGKLRNENLRYQATSDATPETPPTERPVVKDLVVALGGSRLILRDNGTASLVANGNLDVRSTNGVMSLAAADGGDANTDERYVLEGPLSEKLSELVTAVNQLVVAVLALQARGGTTGAEAAAAFAAAVSAQPVASVTPVDRPALQSAMLRVSSKSEAVV